MATNLTINLLVAVNEASREKESYDESYEEGSAVESDGDVEEGGTAASCFRVFLLPDKENARHGEHIDAAAVVLLDPDNDWSNEVVGGQDASKKGWCKMT